MGPISILRGENLENHLQFAAGITLRYSDAPKDESGFVVIEKNDKKSEIQTEPLEEPSYEEFRI